MKKRTNGMCFANFDIFSVSPKPVRYFGVQLLCEAASAKTTRAPKRFTVASSRG